MTSESFAADLGNMIGDGADLAPLMGTFSFSGRDPNREAAEERKTLDEQEHFQLGGSPATSSTKYEASSPQNDSFGGKNIEKGGESEQMQQDAFVEVFTGFETDEPLSRQTEVAKQDETFEEEQSSELQSEQILTNQDSLPLSPAKPVTSLDQLRQREDQPTQSAHGVSNVNPIEIFLKRENIYPKTMDIEIQDSMEEFYQIRKHFLIFSEAGKPVYTRFGDEMNLAPFFATMSAVMPKIQSYYWDPNRHASQNKNELHQLMASGFQVTFLRKGSLIYMCLVNQQAVCPGASLDPENELATYFIDERPQAMQAKLTNQMRPQPIKEVTSFIRKQLEYLHIQFISLMTSSVINLLQMRPNLDIKSNIVGLEKTLDMMCEVSQKSPACFMQAFQPLRIPLAAREVFNEAVKQAERPAKLAFGMMITSLNVINVFTDEFDQVKADDVTVIFNFMMALSSMTNGETWTPICVPGCTEEYMLHVYISFKQSNLGIVLVCTDHQCFEECHEFSNQVYDFLNENQLYAGPGKPSLQEVVNRCTFQMYQENDMKEVQMILVRNNQLDQYTSYNYPLLTKVTFQHQRHLRVFESMLATHKSQVQAQERKFGLSETEATQQLLVHMRKQKKKGQFVDVIAKQVYRDFSYAMVNCEQNTKDAQKDFTLFLVYDHRINNKLEQISKRLFQDLLIEESSIFIEIV